MADTGIPFSKANIDQLEAFVKFCKADSRILHHEELGFFKNYIESLGGRIPLFKTPNVSTEMPKPTKSESTAEPEISASEGEYEESDIELDTTGVIEPDAMQFQEMGDPDREVSEEDMDKSDEKRRGAVGAYNSGDYATAVNLYTEAIVLNPGSALLYAKRGQCHLMMQRPNACIRDCSHALQVNPDNAAAYKFRGRAHRLLGHWEEAARDLRDACKIDFDEQADEWLREVTPNARKLEEHHRKYERKRSESELREKVARARKAREEHAKAAKEAAEDSAEGPEEGKGMGDFYEFLSDPEIVQAFQDPEVAAAFKDISANPLNIMKYQNNPKVSALITKLAGKFGGGAGGFPGGMPGGFPGGFPSGFPGGAPPQPPSGGPASSDDVGLD